MLFYDNNNDYDIFITGSRHDKLFKYDNMTDIFAKYD